MKKTNNKGKCVVKGCKNHIYVVKHKLCVAHYLRYIRNGSVDEGKPVRDFNHVTPYK